jgi:hypothetical protein
LLSKISLVSAILCFWGTRTTVSGLAFFYLWISSSYLCFSYNLDLIIAISLG